MQRPLAAGQQVAVAVKRLLSHPQAVEVLLLDEPGFGVPAPAAVGLQQARIWIVKEFIGAGGYRVVPAGLPVQGLEIAVTELRPREQRDIGIGPAWAMKHPAPGRGRRVEVRGRYRFRPQPGDGPQQRALAGLRPADHPDVDGFPVHPPVDGLDIRRQRADSLA